MPTSIPQGPVSELTAAQLIREANDKAYTSSTKAEIAGMQGVLGAKTQQAENAKKSSEGSVLDATSKFVGSGAAVLTNMKLAHYANTNKPIRQQKDEADAAFKARQENSVAHKAGVNSANQSGTVSQVINNSVEAMSQTVGGQSMIHAAQISDKQQELNETVGKQLQEGGKQGREQASKGQDSANDFVRGIFDRAKQVADKIFS